MKCFDYNMIDPSLPRPLGCVVLGRSPDPLGLQFIPDTVLSGSRSEVLKPEWDFCFFFFLGPHLWHMKVPRPGVELELQLLAYATDQSHVCGLKCSLRQSQIVNIQSEARD